jgi:hypothetical protein
MHFSGCTLKADLDLPPVDLGLVARSGFEAPLGERSDRRLTTQWSHRVLHRVVASVIAAAGAQLLIQNAGRVVHLRGSLGQPAHVCGKQPFAHDLAPVRPPLALAQAAAHYLAIKPGEPRDLGDRLTGRSHTL